MQSATKKNEKMEKRNKKERRGRPRNHRAPRGHAKKLRDAAQAPLKLETLSMRENALAADVHDAQKDLAKINI